MNMKTKLIPSLIALIAIASLSSCQTVSTGGAPKEALTCPKCKMVAFERVGTIHKEVTILRGETMSCPDCESAARNYFTKGISLNHTCKTCGVAMVKCH
jgi:hypothetical protein